jgi:transposase
MITIERGENTGTQGKEVFMGRVTQAVDHLPLDTVREKMHTTDDVRQRKQWFVIYNAQVDPRPAQAIARHTGVARDFVHYVVEKYNHHGPASIEQDRRGGRFHAYLSRADEEAFLAPFAKQAETGTLVTVTTIQRAFERRVGRSVHVSTIYKLLDRHNWRKVRPRPHHPKADPEVQAH